MKQSAKRRSQPKKPRAIQASRHLRTVPRHHTGHILPKRHTSYPTLAMILLCVGVLMAGYTRFVTADPTYGPEQGSYSVHVSVPGPAPSQPATITEPTTGKVFSSIPITVSGNCPVNTYETLYRNSVFSGVALCSAVGDYSLQTDLFPGNNLLQVRDFSSTDVPGPLSNSVTVTYTPPTSGGSSGSSGSAGGAPTEPLILKTNFKYQGYYTGQSTQWNLDIEGGTAPYAISANWGDGQTSLVSRPRAGSFSLVHKYHKSGSYKGSYQATFNASDAVNGKTLLQLLTIINNPPNYAATTTLKTNSGSGSSSGLPDSVRHMLEYLWPSYGVVVLFLTSFWLGERREYYHLKPQLKQRHGRA